MTTAWFHCFSGVAGDMALGALVDAGADLDEVVALVERLPVGGWRVEARSVLRSGIGGTKIDVHAREGTVVRTAAHIRGLVDEARLPDRVADRARRVFAALAESEGRLHRRPADQVHFHEVGGIDAIVDVVGTCAALEVLDVEVVTCSPIAVGLGMVRAAHGIIPNPAPAVVDLLRGIPTRGVDLSLELTTPTGAALMAALATGFGPLPPLTVAASGFGAGSRDLDGRPNLTQVVLGEPLEPRPDDGQPVVLLETNLDDATGEVLAHAVASLLAAGAHDAWITPIVMKKGRPAHTVSVLADPALADDLAAVLVAETGTLGLRGTTLTRWPRARSEDRVEVDGRSVRLKVGPGRAKVEFDDAARVAARAGRPVREVLVDAEAAWRSEGPAEPLDEPVRSADGGGTVTPIREHVEDPVRPFDHDHGDGHDGSGGHDRPHGRGHRHDHPEPEGDPA